MKAYKAFIKPFEAPQRSENKNKLFFYLCPGSEQEGLTTKVKKKKVKGKIHHLCITVEGMGKEKWDTTLKLLNIWRYQFGRGKADARLNRRRFASF